MDGTEAAAPALIIAAVTILSPILAAVLNQPQWSPKVKVAIPFVVSVVLAVVYLVATGGVKDWFDLPVAIGSVYGLQQLAYALLLKGIASKVEVATSVKAGQVGVVTAQDRTLLEDVPTVEDATMIIKSKPEHRADKPVE